MIGDGLAKYLQLKLGDTLVLLGQGYHGSTAAGQYTIQAIFHFPLEQLNNALVYLYLPDAQSLFGAPGRLTSISIMLRQPGDINATTHFLQHSLDSTREVMQWPEMNKSLVQEIQGDNASGIIMLGILYLVVAFGVFGTILMMTLERKKEFAVMIAIGMHRVRLTVIIILETILIGLMGILSGSVFYTACTCIPAPIPCFVNRIGSSKLPAVWHRANLTGIARSLYFPLPGFNRFGYCYCFRRVPVMVY